jgi:hypothetical protein
MPDLFDDLTKRKINYCTTIIPNRKDMSQDLLPQNNQLKCGTILSKTRRTWQQWSADINKWYTYWQTCTIHQQMGTSLMTIWDYNTHMGYADLEEGVMNCYLIQCQTWEWTEKPFFHFTGTTFLNIFLHWLHVAPKWLIETLDYLSDWKGKGLPHPCWSLGRPSYMFRSRGHPVVL